MVFIKLLYIIVFILSLASITHASTSWKIDDLYTFTLSVNGLSGAVDADSVPSYRVYEDEIGTAILTGSMAKLDDTNTTGYYSKQLTLSAANGLEKGKSYSVIICAVISSNTYCTTEAFQIEAEVDSNVVSDKTGYTASTVSDKTGYSLTQTFPTNFTSQSIDISGGVLLQPTQTGVTIPTVTAVTNDVGITQVGADKVWGTTVRAITDKAGFGLANDAIGAAQIAAGAITASEAPNLDVAISTRSAPATAQTMDMTQTCPASPTAGTTGDACKTSADDTSQTGDSFARIGVAGAGLTNIDLPNQTMDITGNLSGSVGSVTGLTASNLDAAISTIATPAQVATALTDIHLDHLIWKTNENGGAVSTASNIYLTSSSGVDDAYKGMMLGKIIVDNLLEIRTIVKYTGSGMLAIVDPPFTSAPANASELFILQTVNNNVVDWIAVTVSSGAATPASPLVITGTTIITVNNQFKGQMLLCGKQERKIAKTVTDTTDSIVVEPGNPFTGALSGTCYIK